MTDDEAIATVRALLNEEWDRLLGTFRLAHPEVIFRTGGIHVGRSLTPGVTATAAVEIGPDVIARIKREDPDATRRG